MELYLRYITKKLLVGYEPRDFYQWTCQGGLYFVTKVTSFPQKMSPYKKGRFGISTHSIKLSFDKPDSILYYRLANHLKKNINNVKGY